MPRPVEPGEHALDLGLGQRLQHRAGVIHALTQAEAAVARHQRRRLGRDVQSVEIGAAVAADLSTSSNPAVATSAIGGSRPSHDGVGDAGGAVDEAAAGRSGGEARRRATASSIASTGASGRDSTLAMRRSPVSAWIATMSVKVPPISVPTSHMVIGLAGLGSGGTAACGLRVGARSGHLLPTIHRERRKPGVEIRDRLQQGARVVGLRRWRTPRRLGPASTTRPGCSTTSVVAQHAHHVQVVADEQQADAVLAPQPVQQLQDHRLHRHVERRRRLVQHQQPRPRRDGAGDADARLLAAGQLVREAVEQVRAAARRARRPRRTRASSAAPSRRPSRRRSGWAMLSKAVCRGLRLSCGSWNTIWISRRRGERWKSRDGMVPMHSPVEHDVAGDRDRSAGRSGGTACSCRSRFRRPGPGCRPGRCVNETPSTARTPVEGLHHVLQLQQRAACPAGCGTAWADAWPASARRSAPGRRGWSGGVGEAATRRRV